MKKTRVVVSIKAQHKKDRVKIQNPTLLPSVSSLFGKPMTPTHRAQRFSADDEADCEAYLLLKLLLWGGERSSECLGLGGETTQKTIKHDYNSVSLDSNWLTMANREREEELDLELVREAFITMFLYDEGRRDSDRELVDVLIRHPDAEKLRLCVYGDNTWTSVHQALQTHPGLKQVEMIAGARASLEETTRWRLRSIRCVFPT